MSEPEALELIRAAATELAREGLLPVGLCASELAPELAIAAIGIDSLGRMLLLNAIESRADVLIPERQFAGLSTLGDLARLVIDAARAEQGGAR